MERATVCLVLAILIAGCSGVSGIGDGTETLTPAPVSTPADGTPESGPLPPGVTGNGVVDIDRLLAAHRRATADTSYTLRTSHETSGVTGNESRGVDLDHVVRVADDSTYSYWTNERVVWSNGRARYLGNYSEYQQGGHRYTRYREVGGRVAQRTLEPVSAESRFSEPVTAAVRRFLAVDNATVTTTRIGGVRHYVLRAHEDQLASVRPLRNVTVRATIRSDGLVRSLSVRYWEGPREVGEFVRYAFEYANLGRTTVERPEWVDAMNETGTRTESGGTDG